MGFWEIEFFCEFHCWPRRPTVKLFARFWGARRPGMSGSYPQDCAGEGPFATKRAHPLPHFTFAPSAACALPTLSIALGGVACTHKDVALIYSVSLCFCASLHINDAQIRLGARLGSTHPTACASRIVSAKPTKMCQPRLCPPLCAFLARSRDMLMCTGKRC